MSWIFWALLSAIGTAVTAILTKVGVKNGIDSTLVLALETIVDTYHDVVHCRLWRQGFGYNANSAQDMALHPRRGSGDERRLCLLFSCLIARRCFTCRTH